MFIICTCDAESSRALYLKYGGVEKNPILNFMFEKIGVDASIIIKYIINLLVTILCCKIAISGSPKMVKIFNSVLIVVNLLYLIIVGHNIIEIVRVS